MEKLSFFADENIQQKLIHWLEEKGFPVSGVRIEKLFGMDDAAIIRKAYTEKKVILTYDSDFGKIIYTSEIKFYSVIYLRPCHPDANFHIATLETILDHSNQIKEGTIIIGSRINDEIKVRIRHLNISDKL